MAIQYAKKEVILHFTPDKKKVYKIQQVSAPAVKFNNLVAEISNSCGVNRAIMKAAVEALIDRMCMYMELGHPVQLGEFGSFHPRITTKSQEDQALLGAGNVKQRKIRFIPGVRFKQMLAQMEIMEFDDPGEILPDTPAPDGPGTQPETPGPSPDAGSGSPETGGGGLPETGGGGDGGGEFS